MQMGKVSIPASGGVGAGSDECTATRIEVLKGYTAITGDSDDEVVSGTLELTGDAADSQVLIGKSYYNINPKNKRTGSMVNNGAVSQTLNNGESYTIPTGYHNGSGKVTANSLLSQTSATASSAQILSGYTAWVNGSMLTGNIASLAGQTINPTTSQHTISCSGKFMTGNITVNGVSNLSAANIKKGVNIGGVVGTFEGWVPGTGYLYNNGTLGSASGFTALGYTIGGGHGYPYPSALYYETGQIRLYGNNGCIVSNNPINLAGFTKLNFEAKSSLSRCSIMMSGWINKPSNQDSSGREFSWRLNSTYLAGDKNVYTMTFGEIPASRYIMVGFDCEVPEHNDYIYRIWLS